MILAVFQEQVVAFRTVRVGGLPATGMMWGTLVRYQMLGSVAIQ